MIRQGAVRFLDIHGPRIAPDVGPVRFPVPLDNQVWYEWDERRNHLAI